MLRWLPFVIVAAGCAEIPLPRAAHEPKRVVTRKKVVQKDGETRLVARDGSSCPVGAERGHRVRVGDRVWCVWTDAGPTLPRPEAPGTPAASGG